MSESAAWVQWFDSHCHLQDYEDADLVVERASAAAVGRIICVGTGFETSNAAVATAASRSTAATKLWATIGLHPHDAVNGMEAIEVLVVDRFEADPTEGAQSPPGSVVAIGECGLDYYYEHSPRSVQLEVFAAQIELAHRYNLALVVHTRDAWDDTFALLQEHGMPTRTIIHCFSGGETEARRFLDLGVYLSFSGIVTFKNADDVRLAAKLCPVDRLLVETDAPYLAPVPHRGKRNEPEYVPLVGAAIAELREMNVDELADVTTANAIAAFALGQ